MPEVDRTRVESAEELRANLLQHIRDAHREGELSEYRRFLTNVANRVAEAHREGFLGVSGERVSDAERQALADIAGGAGRRGPRPLRRDDVEGLPLRGRIGDVIEPHMTRAFYLQLAEDDLT